MDNSLLCYNSHDENGNKTQGGQFLSSDFGLIGSEFQISDENHGSYNRGAQSKGMFMQSTDEASLSYWDVDGGGMLAKLQLLEHL